MSCRDQDQLLSCVEGVGYDQIKLFKFKYKNSTDYLYYSTFKKIGFQQTIMLFCDLLPKLINSKISKEEIDRLESSLIKEYSTHDGISFLELNIAAILDENKADYPTLSVSDIISLSPAVPLTSFNDRLRIMSDIKVDISVSHHFVCVAAYHNHQQPTADILELNMQAHSYDLVYCYTTPDSHACVYERRGDCPVAKHQCEHGESNKADDKIACDADDDDSEDYF